MSRLKVAAAAALFSRAAAIDCSDPYAPVSYPLQYVAYKVDHDLVIDGKLDDAAWQEVAFTSDFVDISTNTTPALRTNVKIRYDDEFLYIGGMMQEPQVWANISWTCHCIDNNQDQVIYHDNDFEIFIDADGSNHYYKEYEMNAANYNGTSATWDLVLNKPYNDGGYENSTRVLGPAGWDDMLPWSTGHCMTNTDGQLNVPGSGATHWSAEVALPLKDLAYNTSARYPPQSGDYWRINFSRVEWAVKVIGGQYQKYPSCQSCPQPGSPNEDNWVWSPQGSIAMHLPEHWGFLQFADSNVNATAPVRNPEWTVRATAMAVYYAQHAYASANNNTYTTNVADLLQYVPDPAVFAGVCTSVPSVQLSNNGSNFNATLMSVDGTQMATITDDRYLRVYSK